VQKLILTDCDGVLLNWLEGFDTFMSEKGYYADPDNGHMYQLSLRHHIDQLEVYKVAKEFNSSEKIARLKPLADAQKYVGLLREQGFSFIAITSLSDHPDAHDFRKRNLEDLFGDAIEELICLDTGAPKADVLSRWRDSGLFWIEDHVKNALDGVDLGLRSILVSAAHNAHIGPTVEETVFARVSEESPWAEIYDLVRNVYELSY
jgi:hypothetical protein